MTLNSHIVVVVRLRVIVILDHGEATHVIIGHGSLGCRTHPLARAAIWQVPVDRKVCIVLELEVLGVRVGDFA